MDVAPEITGRARTCFTMLLKSRISHEKRVISAWLSTPSPLIAEAMVFSGFDALTVDLQHGMIELGDAVTIISSVGRIAPCIARSPSRDAFAIGKLLDAGAQGVICPMINTAEEARAFASACRYPPAGERSYGPSRLRLLTARSDNNFDQDVVAFAMIETASGLKNADAILATPGLDGVFIGPSDLSLSLGYNPNPATSRDVLTPVISNLSAKAKKAGKLLGAYLQSSALVIAWNDFGLDLVCVGSDVMFVQQAGRQVIEEIVGAN